MTLSFDQFVATRTFHPDGRNHPDHDVQEQFEGVDHPQPILVYDGMGVIEIMTPYWGGSVDTQYSLTIYNQAWNDDDLAKLELILFEEWYKPSFS